MTKKYILLLLFISISFACFSQNQGSDTVIKSGVGLGSVIAVVISWDRNKSILWAILHGIFSWLYVIYYALTRD
ncbi:MULTISPECIES: hypothetical protein [Winogradskyella]|uniref:CPBP family intramembrane metalloprotease n=1 Tax=Winogradskyella damuponensis TaxID=943939 RepID=A0ABP8CND4_9FLAO